jgi:NAD(P)-dependent dehydrogenase (short-subunit alcohol dehydrogenase family)
VELRNKNVVIVGGSRGVGRAISREAHARGARVLAVARQLQPLRELSNECPGIELLSLDASLEHSPKIVFERMTPDVLVISAGSIPPTRPIQELSWSEFELNWQTDTKISFLFCRAALSRPPKSETAVILISSGAAFGGSPISGGYAGSKRMQLFLANYCQKEASRLGLKLRFIALAPMRIMAETELGQAAVEGYAQYLGIRGDDFLKGMQGRQSPKQVASAVLSLATGSEIGSAFTVSADGISPVS